MVGTYYRNLKLKSFDFLKALLFVNICNVFNIYLKKLFWKFLYFFTNFIYKSSKKIKLFLQVVSFGVKSVGWKFCFKKVKIFKKALRLSKIFKYPKKQYFLNSNFWFYIIFSFLLKRFRLAYNYVANVSFFFYSWLKKNSFNLLVKKLYFYFFLQQASSFFCLGKFVSLFKKFYKGYFKLSCSFIYKKYIKSFFFYCLEGKVICKCLWFLKKTYLSFNEVLKALLLSFIYKLPEILNEVLCKMLQSFKQQRKVYSLVKRFISVISFQQFGVFGFKFILLGRFLKSLRTKK